MAAGMRVTGEERRVSWPVRVLEFPASSNGAIDSSLEWIVTNGLGGYASGLVFGGLTRRYHGLLIAAHPPPLGRLVCVSALRTSLVIGGRTVLLDHEDLDVLAQQGTAALREFRLDGGLPVWRYEIGDVVVEKRVVMPHLSNTTFVVFDVVASDQPLTLVCDPVVNVKPLEAPLSEDAGHALDLHLKPHGVDVHLGDTLPRLRVAAQAASAEWHIVDERARLYFTEEHARGYSSIGVVHVPCRVSLSLADGRAALCLTTEDDPLFERPAAAWLSDERARREELLAAAGGSGSELVAELVLAADQFIVAPVGHAASMSARRSSGTGTRSVIAGYHWFTDWGRDTMISLDGLAQATGRHDEAAQILRMFAGHVHEGLIPNLFPEGERLGLYHTADATLWFFEAIGRFVRQTGRHALLDELLPTLVDIIGWHRRGTAFGIGVDPGDGLLTQGAPGYALTWMDAKMEGWVVTPRRGKAVEINALWYNALRWTSMWLESAGRVAEASAAREDARRARAAFNARFWNPATGWLFDVVDGEDGDDPRCRPNQLFAISLTHPVLDESHWRPVIEVVADKLVTPLGLRTLAPDAPGYQSQVRRRSAPARWCLPSRHRVALADRRLR